ncbi:MAG: ABC transporter ATP-binding protein [Chloroflexi bacterium CFX4]|nr:ABC transporter ATP-binding protein [Chloroflexi bacterium CFX4]MDL1923911.1 ABC transporter ATP-binding protein [Chloroflexi bacterium CFX3]
MMGGMDGARRLMEREVSKPKNLGATLARFGRYFGRYWVMLLIVAGLIIATTWTQVTAPELIGQAVDCYLFPRPGTVCTYTKDDARAIEARLTADESLSAAQRETAIRDAKVSGLLGLVGVLAMLFLGGAVMSGVMFYLMNWTGQHVLYAMRQDLFKHMHRLSLRFYAENEVGNIMSRLTSDIDTIQQTLNFALVSVASGVLLMGWIVIKMLQANVVYALLSLSAVPFMFAATLYFSSQARKAFRRSRQQMGNVNADLQESIAGVREAQAFSREDENIAEFMRVNAANRDANVRAASFTSALTPTLEALGFVAIAIVVVVGGIAVFRDEPLFGTVISLGTVFAFLQYVQRFNQPIQQIALLWTNIQSAIAGGERIFGLMDTQPDFEDAPNARPLADIKGDVAFVDVRAEYKQGEPVLRGITLNAEAGQTIAIVGPTGAGKTTIINLIPRFYDVSGGAVKIDGTDVREVTLDSLRGQIGIVLQDSFLFADTILNNIRYGKPEATDEEVIAAAKLVAADQFIERLPEGYHTVLGERGGGLSQGQRQLIAIARAALNNPRILILDEATSSVDTRTERIIQKALEKLLHGRTSFVIAHRLSTIRNADQVLFVKDGQIIERGTHTELLAHKGAYYDLYMSQFRRQDQAESGGTPSQAVVLPA